MSNQERMLRIILGFLTLFGLAHLQSSAHAYSIYDQAFKSWVEQYIPGNKPGFVKPYVANRSTAVYTHGGYGVTDENRQRLGTADLTRDVIAVNRAETRARIPRSMSASHPGRKNPAL